MSTGPQSPLRRIIIARQKQVGFRLGIATALVVSFSPIQGWRTMAAWFAAYALTQLVEVACFSTRRPWLPTLDRAARAISVGLLAMNTIVFNSMAVVYVLRLGPWGGTCAAYLLAGSLLNTAMNTAEYRPAFYAAIAPIMAYLVATSLLPLAFVNPPSRFVVGASLFGGILLSFSAVRLWQEWTASKEAETAAMQRDIADRTENEERLFRLAHMDSLTGLANRTVLHAHLADLAATTAPTALLLLDLDGFKYVNDTLGHTAGDYVLREVATRLATGARANDLTVRLGGDEFALLLPGVGDPGLAVSLANRIIASVSRPVMLNGQAINIGASIGVAIHPADGADAEKLFANADLALYQAKGDGRHCARHYSLRQRSDAQNRMSRDSEFENAMEQGAFELMYQPQIGLFDGSVVGAEALLRWRHPAKGLLDSAEFLPALESGRLAAIMGDWVLQTACAQTALWRRQGLTGLRVGVNLFGAQFRSGDLVQKVDDVLLREGLPPDALELEITEDVITRHGDDVVSPLQTLRERGVGIAVDDYGTGSASLSLLKRYPLTRLKIDSVFTQAVCNSQADAVIVRAIISMASAFNLAVTAQGVETQAQANLLRRYGCEEAQGIFYGVPLSASEFAAAYLTQPVAPSGTHGRDVSILSPIMAAPALH